MIGNVTPSRLAVLRAAKEGRLERDQTGYLIRRNFRPDLDVTGEAKAAVDDGQLSVPWLRPMAYATAPVLLAAAGEAGLAEAAGGKGL